MKTSLDIFNELNESFNKDFKTKKQVFMESDGVTIKEVEDREGDIRDEKTGHLKRTVVTKDDQDKMAEEHNKKLDAENVEESEEMKAKEKINDLEKENSDLENKIKNTKIENLKQEDAEKIKDNDDKINKLKQEVDSGTLTEDDGTPMLDAVSGVVSDTIDTVTDVASGAANIVGKAIDKASGEDSIEESEEKESSISRIKKRLKDIKNQEKAKYTEITTKPEDFKKNKPTELKEDQVVTINQTEIEPDYLIVDVTQLNQVEDGDIQAPDIKGMLTLVDESLKADYGEDYGNIRVLSSKINESSSFALVNISTKEIIKEFEDNGIKDIAVGKNLILENVENGLVNFKVNSLNGITKYSKKTNNVVQSIKEWIETEYLHDSMVAKLEEAEKQKKVEELKTMANEKEILEFYLASKPELRMELDNIKMFIELGKEVKDDGFNEMVQNRMYAFATMIPHTIETPNKEDKYELKFTDNDFIVEELFGKNWVKEVTPDNEVIGLKENEQADKLIKDYFNNKMDLSELHNKLEKVFGSKKDAVEYFSDNETRLKQKINESYEQFNIGNIEVVFNPSTYECLYSIPSAEVKDKKINLTKIPTVETPYDTNTIIKDYIETRFGRIPSEEEKKAIDNPEQNQEVENPVETQTTSEEIPNDQVQEAELPEEPDEEVETNVDIDNMEPEEEIPEENQAETGSAVFSKLRPKQSTTLEDFINNSSNIGAESNYIVVDTINLDDNQWNNLASNLNASQDWLTGLESIDRKNYSFNVVKVVSPNEEHILLIDPLGYDYPRYVGIQK